MKVLKSDKTSRHCQITAPFSSQQSLQTDAVIPSRRAHNVMNVIANIGHVMQVGETRDKGKFLQQVT